MHPHKKAGAWASFVKRVDLSANYLRRHYPDQVRGTINANENNNYQNKLDEALLNQDSAADDDKVDIFLIEADYALKYVDSDYALDVKADIGLTDADLAGQYQYTKDIVSVDGSQRGTTWQATPGLFAYRRSIAKEVLGTDDPTEVLPGLVLPVPAQ